jgi:hypothetical protein
VNLFAEGASLRSFAFLLDSLPSHFSVLTGFAMERLVVVNEGNSLYCIGSNESADRVRRDVTHPAMQRGNVHDFIC